MNKNKRLDTYLKEKYPDYSRSYFKKLIQEKLVLVNSTPRNAGYKVKPDDRVTVDFKDFGVLTKIEPENIFLDIIYEDEDLIVVNKPAGMVVHPACGNLSGTLVNALVYHFKNLPTSAKAKDAWIRPGLVHRLDKETSGLILVAKNEVALYRLAKQFENREIKKTYLAICYKQSSHEKGNINIPIIRDKSDRKKMTLSNEGKTAETYFEILHSDCTPLLSMPEDEDIVLVKVMPKTGRTHQIRVHLPYVGLPIIGDSVYGVILRKFKNKIKRTMLHAYQIEFMHPITKKKMFLTASLAKDFNLK
ncbi:MAG: RluA family pseudouridine synthase [Bacteroidetes bacterium]|nr:RluA family pseudouridine synthase [Bacteroidota bacterium]